MHFWILEGESIDELQHKIAAEIKSGAKKEEIPLISRDSKFYGLVSRNTLSSPTGVYLDE